MMRARFSILLFILMFLLGKTNVQAQTTMDYLRHNKTFYLCGYERECSGCYDCGKQKYVVRIKNLVDKKIRKVSYVFYSDVFNKVLTKDAVIVGDVIDYKQVARLNICVPNGIHWAISQITYEDDSKVDFVVNERLEKFIQEPDECDCNTRTDLPNLNSDPAN